MDVRLRVLKRLHKKAREEQLPSRSEHHEQHEADKDIAACARVDDCRMRRIHLTKSGGRDVGTP